MAKFLLMAVGPSWYLLTLSPRLLLHHFNVLKVLKLYTASALRSYQREVMDSSWSVGS